MINITLQEAREIIAELGNGNIEAISESKGGRVWLDGEFQLCELEALCVLIRETAGDSAEGAEELIAIWRGDK